MKKLIALSCLFSGIFISAQSQESYILAENSASSSTSISTKKITYDDHLMAAESFNVPIVKSFDDIEGLVATKKLVAIPEEGNGYTIEKLTHSKAFLNNRAKTVLERIASKFLDENNATITVTSLTRSEESQASLRRVNSNAAKGESSHNYGASFDLSYTKFNNKYSYSKTHRDNLEAILKQLQDDGKIYYIKEYRQHCFHVTVRNPDQFKSTTM